MAGFSPRKSPRKYLFWRPGDAQALAEAETMWAFVDLKSGLPRPLPDEIRTAFDVVEDTDEVKRMARAMSTP